MQFARGRLQRHPAGSTWTRIGFSVVLIVTAVAGGYVAAAPAQAAPLPNCSTLVGGITTDDSFNAAADHVNLGDCNVIDIADGFTFSVVPTEINNVPGNNLTISGPANVSDDSVINGNGGEGLAIATSGNITVTVSRLTFSNFDDTVGNWQSALTLQTSGSGNITAAFTDVAFIGNDGGNAPGGLSISATGVATTTMTGRITFTDNTSTSYGSGALWTDTPSSTLMLGTPGGDDTITFARNTSRAESGGSIAGNDITVYGGTFTDDSAAQSGGSIYANGTVTLEDTRFTRSRAGTSGGAIAADDTITVLDSIFQDDTALQSGGAVISVYASVLSQGSTYRANRAHQNGGAISAPHGVTSTDDTFIGNGTTLYDGGAIQAGRVTTTGSRFTGNQVQRNGGAIAAGSLDDSGSTFIGNRSLSRGGAVDLGQASTFTGSTFRDDSAVQGGAIYTVGPLTVTRSLFEDDTAADSGGAIVAISTLSVVNSTFRGNVALNSGGAIVANSTVNVVDSLFQSNEARGPSYGSNGYGGAIVSSGYAASTTITGTTFTANRSDQEGGALSAAGPVTLTDDTFTGNVSTNAEGGAVTVAAPGPVVATRTLFTGNTSGKDGGAIFVDGTATLTSSIFELNRTTTGGKNGGAISATGDVLVTSTDFAGNSATQWGGAVATGGSATVTDSTFDANSTSSSGGALWIDDTGTIARSSFTDDTSGSVGGAISVRDLIMHSSSFSGNQADYNGGAVFVGRSGDISNSTFANNDGVGGALGFNDPAAESRVAYSTLVNNTGGGSQGTAINAPSGTRIALVGSVLAGGLPLCQEEGPNVPLNLTSTSSYSFASDTSCSGGGAPAADDSINTLYTTDDSLGVASAITTDDTPGFQVVIPDDTSVVNAYVPLGVLPSITTDQLNGLRNSPNGLTSAGAVQVRPTSMTGPASVTVAPGSNATFSVTGYPGIGPTITYQWQRSTDGTTWSNVPGAQATTLTLSSVTASDSGLQVRVLAADAYGNDDTSVVATLTVGSAPPPTPGDPPSAPRNPAASAGDARATVTWSTPNTSGSFPVSSYEVRNDRDGAVCLVPASATPTCTVTGLTNGVAYRFSVRALNGVGWGAWSAWSNAVTPTPDAPDRTITIVGTRQGRDVVVEGTTTGLDGKQVRAMVRFPGQSGFTAGSRRLIDDAGRFTWERATGKRVYVYFTQGPTESNRVSIPAARP